jgi:hypothetical protein
VTAIAGRVALKIQPRHTPGGGAAPKRSSHEADASVVRRIPNSRSRFASATTPKTTAVGSAVQPSTPCSPEACLVVATRRVPMRRLGAAPLERVHGESLNRAFLVVAILLG